MRGFLFHEKYVINPYVRNICVFPYFSCTTEIRFSHVLKIAWIFDSRKIFQKPITFECLCFLILFPYYENSLFLCFGNCMDFASGKICEKLLTLAYFASPYFSRTIKVPFPHVLETILLMWKLIKKIISDAIFKQTFMWSSSLRKSNYFVAEPDPISAFWIPFS